jgi:putative hydrolase of the HAD superfamily
MAGAVRGVLFDYGDTLVTFERPGDALGVAYREIADRLAALGHPRLDAETLLHEVHDRVEAAYEEHRRSGALREINLVAEAAAAYRRLGIDLSAEDLDTMLAIEQRAWWQGVRVDPDAVTVLERLRGAGIRVGLCSNAPYRVRSLYEQLDHVELRRHLDSITFSGAVGWRKPSKQIFDIALAALAVEAASCVMVGDSVRDDVDGARNAGLRTVLLRRDRVFAGAAADWTAGSLAEVMAVLLAQQPIIQAPRKGSP